MAEPENYPGICQLFAEGDALHTHALPDRFRTIHPARSEAFFANICTSAEHHLFVAVTKQSGASRSALVGLIEFRVITLAESPPVAARTFVSIDSLIVTAAYQRRGIGRKLMHEVEQWAVSRSIATIELNVYAFNHSAIRLYEELGYTALLQRMKKNLNL